MPRKYAITVYLIPFKASLIMQILITGSNNIQEKWSTANLSENILWDYSLSIICEFDDIKGKHDLWKDKDWNFVNS